MWENWRQSEICIVINDKSHDSTAKHLSCDELLHCKFITQFAGERIIKRDQKLGGQSKFGRSSLPPTDPSVVAPMRTMRECMRCVATIAVHMINIDTLARL